MVIVGGDPTGLTLAGELALASVDMTIVERRRSQDVAGSRAGGLHSRSIEVFDQRGIADRFLSQGRLAKSSGSPAFPWTSATFLPGTTMAWPCGSSTSKAYSPLGSLNWVCPIYYGGEVTGFEEESSPPANRCKRNIWSGATAARSLTRKSAGIDFLGSDPTTRSLAWRSRASASVP
jgi:hypothetical protein